MRCKRAVSQVDADEDQHEDELSVGDDDNIHGVSEAHILLVDASWRISENLLNYH